MKINSVVLTILAALIILFGGIFFFTKGDNSTEDNSTLPAPTNYEYYWSETCPHCANVAEFLKTWEGTDKIEMSKYEINESNENKLRFFDRGNLCNIPRGQLGVPLLITPKGVCLSGDTPIIDYFKGLSFEENGQN